MQTYDDSASEPEVTGAPVAALPPDGPSASGTTDARRHLVAGWCDLIRHARDHHWADDFSRMRTAMQWATWGADKAWVETRRYTINLIGRHIAQKAASLYARNPTVVVRPAEMMDGVMWDGSIASLTSAMEAAQMGDPMALEIVADYQRVTLDRQAREQFANTVRLVVQRTWDKTFKAEIKQAVRRALTCGVAYVQFDVYRTVGMSPDVMERVHDTRTRIAALEASSATAGSEKYHQDRDAELEQLRLSLAALESEPQVVEQEGIIYSYPRATEIIPDPGCRSLRGFIGAEWVARERYMSPEQVFAVYGVNLEGRHQGYVAAKMGMAGRHLYTSGKRDDALACVWEVYHKKDGTRFVICDGWEDFLEAPHPPPVYRKGFWPWIAIVFNEVELPDGKLFPPSHVMLLREAQDEINQAKQGLREHRRASRPVYLAPVNAFREEEIKAITEVDTFGIVFVQGMAPGTKSEDLLVPVRKHPIDPAIYETSGSIHDMQLVAGEQQANLGPTSGATATEAAIAEQSRGKDIGEDADSLDDSLSMLADEVAAMALDALDAVTVKRIVGEGAVWPEMARQDIAEQLQIEVKAGSSGRPNQAAEVAKLERIAPYLLQIPGINPQWLAEEFIKRLDDHLQLADALAPSMPSITSLNAMQTKMAAGGALPPVSASDDPAAQGDQGGYTDQRPPAPRGGPQPAFDDSGGMGQPGF